MKKIRFDKSTIFKKKPLNYDRSSSIKSNITTQKPIKKYYTQNASNLNKIRTMNSLYYQKSHTSNIKNLKINDNKSSIDNENRKSKKNIIDVLKSTLKKKKIKVKKTDNLNSNIKGKLGNNFIKVLKNKSKKVKKVLKSKNKSKVKNKDEFSKLEDKYSKNVKNYHNSNIQINELKNNNNTLILIYKNLIEQYTKHKSYLNENKNLKIINNKLNNEFQNLNHNSQQQKNIILDLKHKINVLKLDIIKLY